MIKCVGNKVLEKMYGDFSWRYNVLDSDRHCNRSIVSKKKKKKKKKKSDTPGSCDNFRFYENKWRHSKLKQTTILFPYHSHTYQLLACETAIDTENSWEVFPGLKKRSKKGKQNAHRLKIWVKFFLWNALMKNVRMLFCRI